MTPSTWAGAESHPFSTLLTFPQCPPHLPLLQYCMHHTDHSVLVIYVSTDLSYTPIKCEIITNAWTRQRGAGCKIVPCKPVGGLRSHTWIPLTSVDYFHTSTPRPVPQGLWGESSCDHSRWGIHTIPGGQWRPRALICIPGPWLVADMKRFCVKSKCNSEYWFHLISSKFICTVYAFKYECLFFNLHSTDKGFNIYFFWTFNLIK